jgi:hypothetical protein
LNEETAPRILKTSPDPAIPDCPAAPYLRNNFVLPEALEVIKVAVVVFIRDAPSPAPMVLLFFCQLLTRASLAAKATVSQLNN